MTDVYPGTGPISLHQSEGLPSFKVTVRPRSGGERSRVKSHLHHLLDLRPGASYLVTPPTPDTLSKGEKVLAQ